SGHSGPVNSVAITRDGTWLATASDDRTVRIWAVAESRTVAMARAEGSLRSCVWGAAGELAVGGEKGLYLFKLLT
ncbi:WD40 repeat domain-containing protein, partial [Streptomyces galilaeus]|uniref:WD40 repeat domain-containing protein n=1 Tax=Streptomyces galilaeus TaxID=33899 RepID=UPI0038F76165